MPQDDCLILYRREDRLGYGLYFVIFHGKIETHREAKFASLWF
jgi:hypothetical protein